MTSPKLLALCAIMATSCASPKLPNNQTASDQFYKLGYHEKTVAQNFYELGQGDAVKRLYWSQRRAQETGASEVKGVSLQRKYVNIPVPAHTDSDGTEIEASNKVVEIVQLWKSVPNRGRTLNIVK